jgi:hypothetical protein
MTTNHIDGLSEVVVCNFQPFLLMMMILVEDAVSQRLMLGIRFVLQNDFHDF